MTSRRSLSKPSRPSTQRLALEPRIVFDGAMPVAAAEAMAEPTYAEALAIDASHAWAQPSAEPDPTPESAAPMGHETSPAAATTQIAFVDPAAVGIENYLQDFDGEVIVLRSDRDGMTQIAEALTGRSNLAAIHIVSHGEAGRLLLGTGSLDAASIAGEHAANLAAVRAALSGQGDLLLYGCDVAAGATGQAFIEQLAQATGADVAASTDDTGSTSMGGDWDLEARTGSIDSAHLAVTAWEGLLTQSSTGVWTVSGSGNATTANSAVGGVTTTVSFGSFTNAANVNTFVTTGAGGTLNNLAVFSPAVQNTASLGMVFSWDSTPDAGTTEASVGAGTGVITITFSQAVTNPIIHLDRLGGSDGTVQNGMRFTLVNPGGLSLTRLAGTTHFAVDTAAGTIQTNQIDVATTAGYSAESNLVATLGTAAGSVRVNGTVTSVQFTMAAAPNSNEGSGGDGFEIKVSYEPAPTVANDTFTTPHDTPTTFNVRVNDSDVNNDAFGVTAINGTAITAGGAGVAVTGGTVTLLTNGDLTFTPTANYVGSPTFTYTVTDAGGGQATATVTGTVTDVAPVVDLNSGSTASAERVTNGTFTGGATGWTAAGAGTAAGNAYYWDANATTGTLTQSGITGWNNGYGTNGAAQITFGMGWNNGGPDSAVPATLDISVGGVVYARFTSNRDAANGSQGSFTYLNGASGPNSLISSSTYQGWTYTPVTINLPGNVAATGDLRFAFNAGAAPGSDDIAIDNVSVITRSDNTAGLNYTTAYTENGAPLSIAAAGSEVRDGDSANMVSATIVLSNRQAGDLLSVIGSLPGGITASAYDAGTGTITLSGASSAANYATAIRSIGYSSTSENPSTVARTINVTVNDGIVNSAVSTTTIAVTSVNEAPVAVNDSFTTNEDTAATITVRGNDTDPDGDTLTVTQVNGQAISVGGRGIDVTGGVVTLNGAGNLVFTPRANFNGSPSFTYTVRDPGGLTSTATVNGTVTPVNDAPVVNLNNNANLLFDGNFDSTAQPNLNANNLQGTTYGAFSSSASINVIRVNGSTYAAGPDTADSGNQYIDLDGAGTLSQGFTLAAAQTIQFGAAFSNRDLDNGGYAAPGTVVEILNSGGTVVATATTLTLTAANGSESWFTTTGSATLAAGNYTYRVTMGNFGHVDSVYVRTGNNYTTSYTENAAPVAIANAGDAVTDIDSANMTSATIVLTNAQAGDVLSVIGSLPAGITASAYDSGTGTITLSGSATSANYATAIRSIGFSSTSENPSTTPRTVNVTTNDGTVNSNTAVTTITVVPVNDAPTAVNDSFTTNEDTAATISVRGNDTDPEGDTLTVTQVNGSAITAGGAGIAVTGGVVTLNGSGQLIFTPTANYNGSPSFTYTLRDPAGLTSTATVNGTVTPVNDTPSSAAPTSVTLNEDATLGFVGGNALTVSDVDGGNLTVTLSVANGTLTMGTLTGLTFGSGDGTADASMSFTGTAAQINTALASLTYTPTADYNGSDSLSFATSDGSASANRSVGITVNPVADIAADSVTANQGTAFVFNAITGTNGATADSFENGGRVVTSVTQGVNGSVSFNADGTLTYTPNVLFVGVDTFNYTVTSGGVTETASVTVNVTAVNSPPVGNAPTAVTTAEDTTFVFNGGNTLSVSDVESASLTVTLSVTNGTLTMTTLTGLSFATGDGTADGTMTFSGTQLQLNNALASLRFAPTADFNGSASLSFNVNDGAANTSRTVAVTVTPVADATNDTVATTEDTAVSFNVLTGTNGATADNFENGGRTVTAVTQGALGSVSFTAAGLLTYTPNLNAVGSDSFTYTVTSGGVTETATVTVNVAPVNDAPTSAAPASVTTAEDTAYAFTGGNALSVADVDNGTLTVTLSVTNGTLTMGTLTGLTFGTGDGTADTSMTFTGTQSQLNAALASLSFTPNADFNGGASLTFNTSDGTTTTPRTVGITITPVADIVADSVSTNEDTAISFNVLTGTNGASADNFEDGARTVTAVTQGAHGTVSFNAAGLLVFTPALNYSGSDSFTYTVTSGGTTETTTVTVAIAAVNDAPVAVNDSFTTNEDTPVTISVRGNDSDAEGDTLTITQVDGNAITAGGAGIAVTGGVVTLNGSGQLVFTPNANFNGSPSFTYTVADGNGGTATATVSGTVTAVNDPPAAVNDSFTTNEDNAATIDVRGNDSDVEGDTLTVTQVNGAGLTAGGAGVVVNGGVVTLNGAGNLVFTPTLNFRGPTSFTYTVSDGNGGTATATVTGSVASVNDAPVAVADTVQTVDTAGGPSGIPYSGSVLFNDTDVEGDTLTVTSVNGVAGNVGNALVGTYGTLTLNADGSYSYAVDRTNPAVLALLRGQAPLVENFSYAIADGNGGSANTTLTININGTNDSPDAGNDTNAIAQGQSTATGNVITGVRTDGAGTTTTVTAAQDSDPNGDPISINEVRAPGQSSGATVSVGSPGVRVGQYGTLTMNANGSYSYALNNASAAVQALVPGQQVTDLFTYTLTDGASSVDATLSIVVGGSNDAPVAVNDSFTTNEDTAATVNVRANDSDPDADPFNVIEVNGSAITAGGAGVAVTGGVVTLNGAGNLVFTPTANVNGPTSFTYTIQDPSGATSTATVSGSVTAVNDAPVATNDSFTTNEDTAATIAVRGNDSDADGDTLTVTQVNGNAITAGGAGVNVTGGVVTLNGAGQLVFTPSANYNGSPSFTYTVADPSGATSTATVNGTVTAVNDAPAAVNDSFTTAEDTTATISVRGNDSDVEGDTLTVTQVNGSAITAGGAGIAVTGGVVTLNGSGQLVFTPTANFNGASSFTYLVSDGQGGTATATVSGSITPVADAPVAANDSFSTNEDTAATITVRGNDSDADGDTLTVTQVNGQAITAGGAGIVVTGGVVTLNVAGNLVFTPAANYFGSPSFDYTVSDGNGGNATATVNGTVVSVNDAPNAVNDSFTINEDTAATINVRGNDSDVEGDTLTVTQVDGTAITAGGAGVAVTGGVVTLTLAGNLVFTPTGNYFGSPSFDYTVSDGNGGNTTATVNGTVVAVNDAPAAANDSFTTAEDTPATINVRGNDSDVDGDAITVTQVDGNAIFAGGPGVAVTGGVVTLNGAGNLVFTPNANYFGSPSFTYTVADPSGATSSATVNGSVTSVNDAPVATNDSFTTNEDTAATISVRGNDTDADGDTLTISQVNGQAITAGGAGIAVTGGVVTLNGVGQLVYTPNANTFGSPSFTYTVIDGNGGSSTATVAGTVMSVNDAPVATNDSFTIAEDSTATTDVRANDSDADGDTLVVTLVNGQAITAGGAGVAVTGGVVTLNGAGNLVFTPTANYFGATSYTYTVADPSGATSTATVNGTVTAAPDAPVAANDSFSIAEDGVATINVRANDSDADGEAITVTQVNGQAITAGGAGIAVTGGVVTLNLAGNLVYTPAANYFGSPSFSYTVADPGGLTSTANVAGTVTSVNDAPVAANDGFTTAEDTSVTIDVRGNDSDVDGDAITITQINGTAITAGGAPVAVTGGVVSLNGSGQLVFLPNANYFGSPSFTYTVADPSGATSSATVSGTVTSTNDLPVANNDTATLGEDAANTALGNALTNDTDADTSDTLVVSAVAGSAVNVGGSVAGNNGGLFTVNANGAYSFNPNGAFEDLAAGQTRSSSVSYTVSDGQGGTATATITVTVTGVNDAPVTVADSYQTVDTAGSPGGLPLSGTVLINDNDAERSTLAVTQVNGSGANVGTAFAGTYGTLTLNADGSFSYSVDRTNPTVVALLRGQAPLTESFTYTASDGQGGSSSSTLSIAINGTNDSPDVGNDTNQIAQGQATATGNVITGVRTAGDGTTTNSPASADVDPNGDPLTVNEVRVPGGAGAAAVSAGTPGVRVGQYGTLTIAASGAYSYALDNASATVRALLPGQQVTETFIYSVTDGASSVDGTITIVVGGTNDDPLAVADTNSGTEAALTAGNVLVNDSDPDTGQTLSVVAVAGASGNVNGIVNGSTGGRFTINADGSYSFDPNGQFENLAAGQSRVTTTTYTVGDGLGGSATTTLSVTVTGLNDAPLAVVDSFTATEDTPLVINVRANDSDVDSGDTITVTQVDGQPISAGGPGIAVTGGVVTLNGAGNLVFTPNANYNGPASFNYTVADAAGATSVAGANGFVVAVNDAPVAAADSFTIAEDTTATILVRANDSDVDGDPLTVTQVNGQSISAGGAGVAVTGGVVTLNGAGELVFTPTLNFNGSPSFTYAVADPSGLSSTATVSGTVTPAPDAPVAAADSFSTAEDTPVTLDVRANDSDADGDPLTITQVDGQAIVAGGAGVAVTGGVVTLDGLGRLVFTPSANFNGTPSFSYTVADPSGATSIATVSGSVIAANDAPVALADGFTATEDTPLSFDVRANDSDVDGDALTVSQVNGLALVAGGAGVAVTGGVVTLDGAGNLVFTPMANFNGAVSFSYAVRDPAGASATATVSGTVAAVNDAPVAQADSATTLRDTPITVNVLANDSDVEGALNPASVQIAGTAQPGDPLVVPGQGTWSIDPTSGAITFTPQTGFVGVATTINYSVADAAGLRSAGVPLSVTVAAVNRAPQALADSFAATEDTPLLIDVRANDSDADGDTLTVTQVNGSAISAGGAGVAVTGGVVTQNGAGQLVFTPTANYNGPASFNYTVADPAGATATATASGTVAPVNDAPGVVADSFSATEDTPAVLDVRTNDSDVDGDVLTITQVNGLAIVAGGPGVAVTGGVVTLNGAGRLVFTPAADYNGPVVFNYTASDPAGASASGTVSGSVAAVNDAPRVAADSFTVAEDTPVVIDVRANDTDAEGGALTVTQVNGQALVAGGPGVAVNGGVVTLNGAGNLVFTPGTDANGPVAFNYTVADPSGATSTASVAGNVTPVNDAPVAVADTVLLLDGLPVIFDVRSNDRDVDGDALTVSAIDGQAIVAGGPGVPVPGGVVTLGADGRLSYVPNPGETGESFRFSVTVRDAAGLAATAFVSVVRDTVLPPAATAVADTPFLAPPSSLSTVPALHVLASVSDTRSELALRANVGSVPVDAATAAEIGLGLGDDLSFAAGNQLGRPQLIGRDTDLSRQSLLEMDHTLFVQHAVRYESLTANHALFVQSAVRSSQIEARVAELRAGTINSAVPGVAHLFDAFALGSPSVRESRAEAAADARATTSAQARAEAASQARSERGSEGAPAASAESEEDTRRSKRAAPGFSAQLQRNADDFRARSTRATSRDSPPPATRVPMPATDGSIAPVRATPATPTPGATPVVR